MSKKNKKYREVNGVMVPIEGVASTAKYRPAMHLYPVIFENDDGNVVYGIIEAEDISGAEEVAAAGELHLMSFMMDRYEVQKLIQFTPDAFDGQKVSGLCFISDLEDEV